MGSLFGSDKAPEAPDLSAQYEGLAKFRSIMDRFSADESTRAFQASTNIDSTTRDYLDFIMPSMQRDLKIADDEYDRYMDSYVPAQEKALRDAMGYDTPDRRQREADRAKADIEMEVEGQRARAEQQLASYGVQPDERGRLDKDVAIASAANKAAAASSARNNVEKMGMQLVDQQARFGEQIRQNADNASGRASQYAGAINQSQMNAEQAKQGLYDRAGNYAQASGATHATEANMKLGQHSAEMAVNEFNSSNSGVNKAMGLAGTAAGVAATYYGGAAFAPSPSEGGPIYRAEGGGIPDLQGQGGGVPMDATNQAPPPGHPTDTVKTNLTPGEFVIPEEVVRFKGEEFFHKLLAKTKETKAEIDGQVKQQQGPAPAIPMGQPKQGVPA